MSRKTILCDERFTIVTGVDQMLGVFYQLYDKEMESETPDGEGIVLDWSQGFKFERNLTGLPNDRFADIEQMCHQYIYQERKAIEDYMNTPDVHPF